MLKRCMCAAICRYTGQTAKNLADVLQGQEPPSAGTTALALASCIATCLITGTITREARRMMDSDDHQSAVVYKPLQQDDLDHEAAIETIATHSRNEELP
eukprot:SAG31_NODE_4599_length_3104_cov_4.379368_2_plen_100_part_00